MRLSLKHHRQRPNTTIQNARHRIKKRPLLTFPSQQLTMCVVRKSLLFACLIVCTANGFIATARTSRGVSLANSFSVVRNNENNPQPLAPKKEQKYRRPITCCFLVTEDDVLEAVEDAEKIWAAALEARKTANALSDRAEEEAEAASFKAKEVEEKMKDRSKPISMETLAEGDAVARSSLDAGSMVNRALQASEEADRLLAEAEIALQKSEERLDQHLIDFPDSPLAQ